MKVRIMRQPEDLNAQTRNKKNKKVNPNKNVSDQKDKKKQRKEKVFEPILTR